MKAISIPWFPWFFYNIMLKICCMQILFWVPEIQMHSTHLLFCLCSIFPSLYNSTPCFYENCFTHTLAKVVGPITAPHPSTTYTETTWLNVHQPEHAHLLETLIDLDMSTCFRKYQSLDTEKITHPASCFGHHHMEVFERMKPSIRGKKRDNIGDIEV